MTPEEKIHHVSQFIKTTFNIEPDAEPLSISFYRFVLGYNRDTNEFYIKILEFFQGSWEEPPSCEVSHYDTYPNTISASDLQIEITKLIIDYHIEMYWNRETSKEEYRYYLRGQINQIDFL